MQNTYISGLIDGLDRQRRMLQIGYGGVVLAYIVCILALLVDVRASVVMVNITTIVYIFVMRSMDKKYNHSFVRANLKLSGEKQLDCVTTFAKGDITSGHIIQSGLLPVRRQGGVACGMGFEGDKGALHAVVCDMTVCFDRTDPEVKQKIGILNGVWMELRLDKNIVTDFMLIERTVFDSGISEDYYRQMGYCEIAIRNRELSERFCLFGRGSGSAEASEQGAERFLKDCRKLIKKTSEEGCGLIFRYSDMGVFVFLVGRKLGFDTPIRGEITEDVVAWNRVAEFGMGMEIVG